MTITEAFKSTPIRTTVAEYLTGAAIFSCPFWAFPLLNAFFKILAGF